MSTRIARCLLLFTVALPCLTATHAQDRMYQPRPLPESAWQVLNAASGVVIGGEGKAEVQVQVIFDAHCPYCARLYERLEQDYPKLVVRWVPIAYFKPDSEHVAAAILATNSPATSLARNFHEYDYARKRGGFRAPPYDRYHLGPKHEALKRRWLDWGGYSPMLIAKTSSGDVVRATGSSEPFLQLALEK